MLEVTEATGGATSVNLAAPDVVASHRANNFDTMRLLAALGVIAAHSMPLTYGPGIYGPHCPDGLFNFSHQRITIGGVSVAVFFIISGYLITASYLNTGNARRFMRARFLRLAPALLVVLSLLAFGLGPLLTTLPRAAYFHSWLPYRAAIGMSDHLPGVFAANPNSSGIDGSLWTLRFEALCYVAVLCLGLAGQLNRGVIVAVFLFLAAGCLYLGVAPPMLQCCCFFAAGAVLYVWQPPFAARYAIPCAIAWVIAMRFGGFWAVSYTAFAYLVIYIGLAKDFHLPNLARYGDVSYGVYIYAWPVQQTVIALLHVGWVANIIITMPIALALGWLSWHFIESPALRMKRRKLFHIF